MKCSFCEQPLACKACHKPFHPNRSDTHLAAYQPDMEILCPECQKVLVCRGCGFVYGSAEKDEED